MAQQLRTADEISRNLSEAANGVIRISEDSAAVAEGVQRLRAHAQGTQAVASDLVRLSTTLGRIAGRLESPDPAVPATATCASTSRSGPGSRSTRTVISGRTSPGASAARFASSTTANGWPADSSAIEASSSRLGART